MDGLCSGVSVLNISAFWVYKGNLGILVYLSFLFLRVNNQTQTTAYTRQGVDHQAASPALYLFVPPYSLEYLHVC